MPATHPEGSRLLASYHRLRPRFRVGPDLARETVRWAQPRAIRALGVHAQPHLLDGWLPIRIRMTDAARNAGWGLLMPAWFQAYERPVPLTVLDDWALFACLYGHALDAQDDPSFNLANLVRVVLGSDILIPFLPTTRGAGRFFRHGSLTLLVAMAWLEEEHRDAWLAHHRRGAAAFVERHGLSAHPDPAGWLESLEEEAFLATERASVVRQQDVERFLSEPEPRATYRDLFGGLAVGVTALAARYRAREEPWTSWASRAIHSHYRMPGFGAPEIRRAVRALEGAQP